MDAVDRDVDGVFPLRFQRAYYYYNTSIIIFVGNGYEELCDCAKWQKLANHCIFTY
jgi:hypothetical protein